MTNKLNLLKNKVQSTISFIKKQYLSKDGDLPWLIGYSGGKDSTCTSQLVFKALCELKEDGKKLKRKVVIFSSDTLIENPLVKEIIEKNIELINKNSKKIGIPLEAIILKPTIDNTFWVNLIGKGYPTPNTMFRWCTDRMKIMPANTFVKDFIDKNGEVIMVLGVREGESIQRDKVLKAHEIKGETLTRHTTLTNAFVFTPIKNFDTTDVFLYLNEFTSPWGSNNKELYFFYEESGGGECPIFLSQQDKTSSNSCGNSRMGCWCCTVVSKDKSLSGFLETGWHDELKPLLKYRNWLVSIRDDEEYRQFYRMNGMVYTVKLDTRVVDNKKEIYFRDKKNGKTVSIPLDKSGKLPTKCGYKLVEKDELSKYLKKNKLNFKSSELSKLILRDSITDEYHKIGTGPFNEKAKKEMFYKLIETEKKYNNAVKNKSQLISDEEISEIKKIWLSSSIDIDFIDKTLSHFGRNKVEIVRDSFELMNKEYEEQLRSILDKEDLDFEILNDLIRSERKCMSNDERDKMIDIISSTLESDKINYY